MPVTFYETRASLVWESPDRGDVRFALGDEPFVFSGDVARVEVRGDGYWLVDSGQRYAHVNEVAVDAVRLARGDRLRIGAHVYRYLEQTSGPTYSSDHPKSPAMRARDPALVIARPQVFGSVTTPPSGPDASPPGFKLR